MYTRTVFIVVTYVCETYSNAIDIQNTVEKYWDITTESVCHIVICRICLDVGNSGMVTRTTVHHLCHGATHLCYDWLKE